MKQTHITSLLTVAFLASAAMAADAPEQPTAEQRVEIQQLPRKLAAARGDPEARSSVIDAAIRLGPMGIERLSPLVQKEAVTQLTRYSNTFKTLARRQPEADAATIVGSNEALQAVCANLLEAGTLLVKLEQAGGKDSASAEEQLAAAETQFLREVRLGPILSQLSDDELSAIEETNKQRVAQKLPPLTFDLQLCLAARDHSADMAAHGFFSHISPVVGKTTPVDRAKRFGTTASSENIFEGSEVGLEAVNAWMNSEGHRANILRPSAKRIGVGYHHGYWTQLFGE